MVVWSMWVMRVVRVVVVWNVTVRGVAVSGTWLDGTDVANAVVVPRGIPAAWDVVVVAHRRGGSLRLSASVGCASASERAHPEVCMQSTDRRQIFVTGCETTKNGRHAAPKLKMGESRWPRLLARRNRHF